MGFLDTHISLPTALLLLLAQKVTNPVSLREPNASSRRPTYPSLGKEAHALTGSCFAHRLRIMHPTVHVNTANSIPAKAGFSGCKTCGYFKPDKVFGDFTRFSFPR